MFTVSTQMVYISLDWHNVLCELVWAKFGFCAADFLSSNQQELSDLNQFQYQKLHQSLDRLYKS